MAFSGQSYDNWDYTIDGSNFGTQSPFSGTNANIHVADPTSGWGGGYSGDLVGVNVTNWSNSQITIAGYTGSYGEPGETYITNPGDTIQITVDSPSSGLASNVYQLTLPVAVSAPTGLNTENLTNEVLVEWNNVIGATSYNVLRNTTNTFSSATELHFSVVPTSGGDSFITDTSATPGVTYYYWVVASNGSSFSAPTAPVTGEALSPLMAPSNVQASNGTSTTQVTVTWNVASGATSYDIYRNTTNSLPESPFKSDVTGTSYSDTSATPGTTYYYWVQSNNSTQSSSTYGGPAIGYAALGAPTGLYTESLSNGVLVGWNNVTGATSYTIFRNTTTNSSTATALGFPVNSTSGVDAWYITDTSATPGVTYYYWVEAYNGAGRSSTPGGPVAGEALSPLPAPTDVQASQGTSTTSITVTWNAAAGATSYTIYRNTTDSPPPTAVAIEPYYFGTSYLDTNSITAGVTYYYWIQSNNSQESSTTYGTASGYAALVLSVAAIPPTGEQTANVPLTATVESPWGSIAGQPDQATIDIINNLDLWLPAVVSQYGVQNLSAADAVSAVLNTLGVIYPSGTLRLTGDFPTTGSSVVVQQGSATAELPYESAFLCNALEVACAVADLPTPLQVLTLVGEPSPGSLVTLVNALETDQAPQGITSAIALFENPPTDPISMGIDEVQAASDLLEVFTNPNQTQQLASMLVDAFGLSSVPSVVANITSFLTDNGLPTLALMLGSAIDDFGNELENLYQELNGNLSAGNVIFTAVPANVAQPTATVNSTSSATVTWGAFTPSDGESVANYTVYYDADGFWWPDSQQAASTSTVLNGLSSTVEYSCWVVANGNNGGEWALGDSTFDTSNSGTQGAAATITTVQNASLTYGQNLTLSANVMSSNSTVNGGAVTFNISQGKNLIMNVTSDTVSDGVASAIADGLGAGDYTIDAIYNPAPSNPNFSTSFTSDTLIVATAPLTITGNNQTKVYGQPDPTLMPTYSGFVNGDEPASLTVQPTLSVLSESANAGTYTIQVSGAVDPNYDISYVNGVFTINRAAPAITLASPPANLVYDGTNDVTSWVQATLEGVAGAAQPTGSVTYLYYDGTTDTGTSLASPPINSGTYTVVADYDGDHNYMSAQSNPVTFTINAAGNLAIQTLIAAGAIAPNAYIILYDSNWDVVGSGSGGGTGGVNFDSLTPGLYHLEEYADQGGDFWATTDVTVTANTTTKVTLQQNQPYESGITILNSYTNANITNGSVALGVPLVFEVQITNATPAGQSVSVTLALSDGSTTVSPTSTESISANSVYTFDIPYTPSTTGTYEAQITVATYTNDSFYPTDTVPAVPIVTVVQPSSTTVANQYMFYYGSSAFDKGATSPSSYDYNAIAENANVTDKTALAPGHTGTFANVSSYADGINGILIDFGNEAAGVTFTASDFAFAVGNNSTPSTWGAAPTPTAIATWIGPNNDTFADITWANNAIQEEWLQVTVVADANTHLASNDVFYFGSLIGATGTDTADGGTILQVTAGDLVQTQNNASILSSVLISNLYDYNRDGYVTAADLVLCQNNATLLSGLEYITPGSSAPAVAPPAKSAGTATTVKGAAKTATVSFAAASGSTTALAQASMQLFSDEPTPTSLTQNPLLAGT
jgi:hypothetical protein